MAKVFDAELTKKQLLDRVGHIEAVAGVRRMRCQHGLAKGMDVYQVRCGRLAFTVLIDKCMDIGEVYLDGVPLHFVARGGTTAPGWFYDGPNAPRSISGGMLFTCGLSNVGPLQEMPGGRTQPQHGFIRNTPAATSGATGRWEGDDYLIEITGEVREAALFGENLVLRRTITAKLGEESIAIRDEIENEGQAEAPMMVMYHCNAGWPLLDENARLIIDPVETKPRDAVAAEGLKAEDYDVFGPPEAGYAEQVFYHKLRGQGHTATAVLANPARRLALRFDIDQRELPYLIQWKCKAAGDYVMGIEPANCHPEGQHKEAAGGTLRRLAPGEVAHTALTLTALAGAAAAPYIKE